MCNHRANQRVFKEMDHVKTNDQQRYRVVPDVYDERKGTTNLLRMQQLCSSLRKVFTLSDS